MRSLFFVRAGAYNYDRSERTSNAAARRRTRDVESLILTKPVM